MKTSMKSIQRQCDEALKLLQAEEMLNWTDEHELSVTAFESLREVAKTALEEDADQITLIWDTNDVIERAEEQEIEVSNDEARDILATMLRDLDHNHGITWETIDVHLAELVRERAES